MKQYIRTPNEIYDLDDLYVCEELNGKPYGVKGSGFVIYRESIWKTSEDITDLFNKYITFNKTRYKIYDKAKFERLKQSQVMEMVKNGVLIYGCIWAKGGLKYVARLHEDNEWRLLWAKV